MSNCKSCKYWMPFDDECFGQIAGAGVCKAAPQVWDVTGWDDDLEHRKILPKYENTKAFVKDGSDYRAELQTLPDFGCVMHEPKPEGKCNE